MRWAYGKWITAQVLDNGDVVAEFNDGGLARLRFNEAPFDPTEGLLYDRPVWEALSDLRTADPRWLKTVTRLTRIVSRSE